MRRRDDLGSATILALVLVAVLGTLAVAGAAVGGVLVGQRRAASAADLAALAAAEALGPGGGSAVAGTAACDVAGRVSEANGARLVGCVVEGFEVVVEVAVDVPSVFGMRLTAPGRARAGPGMVAGPGPIAAPGPIAGSATGSGGRDP